MTAQELEASVTSALSALVGGRIFPNAALDLPARPYFVTTFDAEPENSLCGRSDLARFRLRLDIYADLKSELLALRPGVLGAMDGLRAIPLLETEAYEPEIRAMRRVMDFALWAKE